MKTFKQFLEATPASATYNQTTPGLTPNVQDEEARAAAMMRKTKPYAVALDKIEAAINQSGRSGGGADFMQAWDVAAKDSIAILHHWRKTLGIPLPAGVEPAPRPMPGAYNAFKAAEKPKTWRDAPIDQD